jgi:xanthine dehydrogenase accessory factor
MLTRPDAAAIAAACARLAAGGGAGALASVARRRGSLPMSGTAKLLVTADGRRTGTVGGGCVEAEVVERALSAAATRRPALSEHTLNAELAGDYGLTCGGTAVIFLEPVYPDPLLARVHAACADLAARGGRGVVATALDWSAGPAKALLPGAGTPVGEAPPALLAAARAYARDAGAELPSLGSGGLVERLAAAPRLVVFGGGHVGARVAEAAAFAGWRVTVADDRPEFADPARLPFAERVVACDPRDVGPAMAGADPADTYAVVCTRGHQHDAVIVDQLARLDLRYLGMLGSRRKVALTWRLLESWGVAPERLASVHAPVGLSIAADTPSEIAVSVVAQMIAVRRGAGRAG